MRREYWVKAPKGARRTFAILERRERKKSKTLRLPEVDAVNAALKAGTLDLESARAEVDRVKARLQAEAAPVHSSRIAICEVNAELGERWFRKTYGRKKIAQDSARSARSALRRALASLGDTSLLTAKVEELQRQVDRLEPRRQRRAVATLNRLLAFAGRAEDRLFAAPEEQPLPAHLTPAEFSAFLALVPEDLRLPLEVAFATGCRLGEVFALAQFSQKTRAVHVAGQMLANGTLKVTKTRRSRWAAVSPEGEAAVRRWLEVPQEERRRLRRLPWSRVVRKASGGRVCFHDLRHSYAIAALVAGVPLTWVAQSLGNSVAVCQRYYAGFSLTDEGALAVRRVWGGAA